MGVRNAIADAIKEAQDGADDVRASTLRLVQCAIKDRDIAAHAADRTNGCEEVEIRGILSQMVRQREQSAQGYEEAGRLEMAERERAEIAIIESFLPRQLDPDETRVAVEHVVDELGATGLRDIGRVMGELKGRFAGRMDFAQAGDVAKAMLA